MTMKWRARSVCLTAYAIVAVLLVVPSTRSALTRSHSLSPIVAFALLIGIWGALYGLTFVAFRCPHCGARQVRGRWDLLLISDRCWRCQQLLDGPALPSDVLDEQLIANENPTLAADMRRDRLALEDLAQRALTDPTAAEKLGRELELQVERQGQWVAIVRAHDPGMEGRALEDLKRAQNELAQWRTLRFGTSNGSRLTSA
jgi:hypothetical protein